MKSALAHSFEECLAFYFYRIPCRKLESAFGLHNDLQWPADVSALSLPGRSGTPEKWKVDSLRREV